MDILISTPCTAVMPTNTHETLTQLAGLLGDSATSSPAAVCPMARTLPTRTFRTAAAAASN